MAVITYIGVLILVPLITGKYKSSPFLKFHFNQAIIFCIGYVLGGVIFFIPLIGGIVSIILNLVIFVLQVISIIHAAKGETKSFPILDKIQIVK